MDMLNIFHMPLYILTQTSLTEMVHESHEWLHSIYGDIEEELPPDMPTALGKMMLCIEGFTPYKANSDVWMQCNSNTYEYVAAYVDDLLCAMQTMIFTKTTIVPCYLFR